MINHHLEQMAQAIFKSWFVDFEPWSGVMPYDWQTVTLDDLCVTVTKGTTPTTLKRQFVTQGINFVKAESILDDHSIDFNKLAFIDEETNALLSRSVIQENDIIFTIAGTLGRFAFVKADLLPANTNQAVAIIRADTSKINPVTLYSFFIGGLHSDFYTRNIQQAVQANLSLTTIKALPLLLPPRETLAEYSALVKPLFEQIFQCYTENRHLATLRDTLLPRLMSGELSVSDIDSALNDDLPPSNITVKCIKRLSNAVHRSQL
jgi:type I restriction enzyme S subunit